MYFKILSELGLKFPSVLVHYGRDDDGDFVEIKAVGTIDEDENQFAIEEVRCNNVALATSYIEDFSTRSAVEFCKRHNITF